LYPALKRGAYFGYNLDIEIEGTAMARKCKSTTTTETGPRQAYGYVRVSLDQQADGFSLDAQRERIAAICTLNGWQLVEVFCDAGVSGSVPLADRPEGSKLWASVASGEAIVTAKQDRLSRNTRDSLDLLEQCRKRNVGLVFGDQGTSDIATGAAAELIFTLMSGVSTFERARLRERIKEAKAVQKGQGEWLGGQVPFASRIVMRGDKAFVEADTELQAHVRSLSAAGHPSRTIVNLLRLERGIDTTPKSICRFLRENA